jgi:hypothetical protein
MKIKQRLKNPLAKRAKKGFRGYPVGTIAFYGPTAQQATKVVVGIVTGKGSEPEILERWFAEEEQDLRFDEDVAHQIVLFCVSIRCYRCLW